MVPAKRIILPYSPRRVFLPFHNRSQRFAVGVAHRRAGKTVACVNDKIKRAITTPRENYRAAYVAPFLRQAKDIAWQYVKQYSQPLWGSPPNESELFVTLVNGARIRLYGADNPDALRGGYLDDLTLDEYADMRPSVWGEIIRPMLADRQGTATFIGTPKGKNAFWEIYKRSLSDPENWFSFVLRASETGLISESELSAARLDMTQEQYEQEFECSFDAAILGAYYGREMAEADRQGRLVDNLPLIDGPIHCAWDFGNGANMAIWAFQVSPEGPRVHDFIQISGLYFDGYIAELKRRGYDGFDYVPHDAKVPSFETGRTRIETLAMAGRKPVLIADHHVDDGINAGKLTLAKASFNAGPCAPGLEALRQYRQEWDEKARVFKKTPLHDWASHPADAWRYLSMAWREIERTAKPAEKPALKTIHDMTLDEIWKMQPGRKRERV